MTIGNGEPGQSSNIIDKRTRKRSPTGKNMETGWKRSQSLRYGATSCATLFYIFPPSLSKPKRGPKPAPEFFRWGRRAAASGRRGAPTPPYTV